MTPSPLVRLLHEHDCQTVGLALHDAGNPDASCGIIGERLGIALEDEFRALRTVPGPEGVLMVALNDVLELVVP